MNNNLYAHTPNADGRWQTLEEHLTNVARLTAWFSSDFAPQELGFILGLLHDIGKASSEFQQYLRKCHEAKIKGKQEPIHSPDHKIPGALIAKDEVKLEFLALPLLGHHGGLLGREEVKSKLFEAAEAFQKTRDLYTRVLKAIIDPKTHIGTNLPSWISKADACELFVRMLFSALVDADFIDTESHWKPEHATLRARSETLFELWESFQKNQETLLRNAKDTLVNRCRHEIYLNCIQAADTPQGVFLLTVPTGGGKTRSAMAFALAHALKHNLRRIIVAIPYTSIIDQNAQVYRSIFGDQNVVEHHSAIDVLESGEYSESELRRLLATENWDAPIIVTTTVQLFESLFSNKPSRCRKLHNLARSVIVLDEVQTLPMGLLQPILDVLRELVEHYGVTLVLSTATQPALNQNSRYIRGFNRTTEIVTNSSHYFEQLKRVQYRVVPQAWDWDRVAEEISQHQQVLCIVNSRKDALEICRRMDPDALFHLSTLLCPAHRKAIISTIKDRLSNGLPCRVVSTQVVEAGVDLDFPKVFRAFGPLDRVVQAAGRCNREGLLGHDGEVVLFKPCSERAPTGPYATATKEANYILSDPTCDLHDPNVFEKYFSRLWQNVNLDAHGIAKLRQGFSYPETAAKFKMIEDDTIPVVVPYDEKVVSSIIARVQDSGVLNRYEWQKLQQYCVGLRYRELERHRKEGLARAVLNDFYVWEGAYDRLFGLSEEFSDPADLII
jgi:CRISPR-associated endonuclease/helicase Cas3